LSHRHAADHECPAIDEQRQAVAAKGETIKAFIASNISQGGAKGPSAGAAGTPSAKVRRKKLSPAVELIKMKMHAKVDARTYGARQMSLTSFAGGKCNSEAFENISPGVLAAGITAWTVGDVLPQGKLCRRQVLDPVLTAFLGRTGQ